ncbi:hypothetical protein [Streptomyces antarcticus]|uniref:hypothetical protein n=1 Tax=Streptomyces antarcticus TaxID=2996458 RepID=UPI0022715D56|nr:MULTISPECIES: hypothetical protein [unclassified Streptomyces]MCY0941916.1 hypothetical protein [Streptomyces sp. H34-AA3]MCZ4082811.1 hypothetical protein [Streptomyces sp. H34-S5]
MAELSYPFSADNANGGRAIVSQTQWQAMASTWGGDRIDYTLANTSYASTDLPFSARIVNGRSVEIKPGKAWVGGFYYQLTATKSVVIESNPGTQPRKDLVVIQTDMAKSATALAVVKGTAGASPVAPQPRRTPGGLWEMVLYEVDVAAQDASVSLDSRLSFNLPAHIATPWNTKGTASLLPHGSMVYDLDVNGNDAQYEAFNGRDGYVISRDLGKPRYYRPEIVNVPKHPAVWQEGHWRWIAPNTVHFSAFYQNLEWYDAKLVQGAWTCGITLPVPASGAIGQIFAGHIDNTDGHSNGNDMPNFVSILAKVNRGANSQTAWLYMQSKLTPGEGMDGVPFFPRRGGLTVTGTYEAAQL